MDACSAPGKDTVMSDDERLEEEVAAVGGGTGGARAAELREVKKEAVVEALAAGTSYSEAGRAVKVTARTVQRWLDEDDGAMLRRVAQRRREMTSEVTGRLTDASARAVTVLTEALDAEEDRHRLRAAQLILSLTTRFRTVEELETRVVELVARLDALTKSTAP